MNSRQNSRKQSRRSSHAAEGMGADQPAVTMNRMSYTAVEEGHIVPKTFQKAWVVDGRVKVHEVGVDKPCRLRPLKKTGVRKAPYRRERPSGEKIDDVEASLNVIETKATEPLRALNRGESLTTERKGILAQFFGIQLVRSSVFQEGRGEIGEFLRQIPADAMKRELLDEASGNVDRARELLVTRYMGSTSAMMAMLQYGTKLAGILGLMRWQLIRFKKPRVVYSDHPVVLWPLGLPETQPFSRQQLGPHQTLEIRVPIGPTVGLLMNWIDRDDDSGMEAPPIVAAEFNAFTVAQAELEWMHQPGREPRILWRKFAPLTRLIQPDYGRDVVVQSRRYAEAGKFTEGIAGWRFATKLPVL